MAAITGRYEPLVQALRDAGLANERTRRVVLDISSDEPVTAYIEQLGDERVVQVADLLADVAGVQVNMEGDE